MKKFLHLFPLLFIMFSSTFQASAEVVAFRMNQDDVPLVELRASDCGIDNFTTNSIIRATQPPLGTVVTAYEWRFVELEAPFNTYELISPNGANPNYRLLWFANIAYNRNYEVSVRIYEDGVPGAYGNTCEIGLQANVLTTRLQQQYSNGLFAFCDVIGADAVGGASQYRWEFDDFENVLGVVGDGNSRLLRMWKVPNIQLGQIYIVRVFATVNGMEGPLGTQRFINMNNFVPNTGLRQDLYACGATYPVNTQVQAVEVCRAESYTWRFRNTSQVQADIFYTRDDGSRFIRLDWISEFIFGDSYDVDVRAFQGGLNGDYSTVCNITIEGPTTGFTSGDPVSFAIDAPVIEEEISGLTINANQVSGSGSDMNVSITNPTNEKMVQLSLYDLSGRLVGQRQVSIFDQATIAWPTGSLNTGIYILRADNGLEISTFKIALF
jgi:hypothetical protein